MILARRWFIGKKVERTIAALKRNKFDAYYYPTKEEAVKAVMDMIPDNSVVGFGDSITVLEESGLFGLFRAFKKKRIALINPFKILEEELEARRDMESISAKISPVIRDAHLADIYITGTNAITEEGQIFNIDAYGNRVAAICCGPKKRILMVGINKIVRNLEEAVQRTRQEAAPANSKRHHRLQNPCATEGRCMDCDSPTRICNIFVTLHKKPLSGDIVVIIIGEELGL